MKKIRNRLAVTRSFALLGRGVVPLVLACNNATPTPPQVPRAKTQSSPEQQPTSDLLSGGGSAAPSAESPHAAVAEPAEEPKAPSADQPAPLPPLQLDQEAWKKFLAEGDRPNGLKPRRPVPLATSAGVTLYPWLIEGALGMRHVACQALSIDGEVVLSCGHNSLVVHGNKLQAIHELGLPRRKIAGTWITSHEGGEEPDFGWSFGKQNIVSETVTLVDATGAWALIDGTWTSEGLDFYHKEPPRLRHLSFKKFASPGRAAPPPWPAELASCLVKDSLAKDAAIRFDLECEHKGLLRIVWDGKTLETTRLTELLEREKPDCPSHLEPDAPEWARSFERHLFGDGEGCSTLYQAEVRVVRAGEDYWLNHPLGVFSTRRPEYTYTSSDPELYGGADIELLPPVATEECPTSYRRVARTSPRGPLSPLKPVPLKLERERLRNWASSAGLVPPYSELLETLFQLRHGGEIWLLQKASEQEYSLSPSAIEFCLEPSQLRPVPKL